MAKGVVILGSTGSIGTQTLEVIAALPGMFEVWGLAAGSNIDLLAEQARRFRPRVVAVAAPEAARALRERLSPLPIDVLAGPEGVEAVASMPGPDVVLPAMVGTAGLKPTLAAIRAGKDIALANKETLVAAGELVTSEAARAGIRILPVDSEHSAIFQCLNGEDRGAIRRILLTASGGPFRGFDQSQLETVTPEQALKHPRWTMGPKITVDSATLMNKGLEVIEAHWLFGVPADAIDVIVHPQSVIHSLVEFADGAIMAQMGVTDMRVPIQYALTYPGRALNDFPRLDLIRAAQLTFEAPDTARFPCLRYAYEALEAGGTMPAAMNAANEVAVRAFLDRRVGFAGIPRLIEKTMEAHRPVAAGVLDGVLEADSWARRFAADLLEEGEVG